jgi:hypothetical protein
MAENVQVKGLGAGVLVKLGEAAANGSQEMMVHEVNFRESYLSKCVSMAHLEPKDDAVNEIIKEAKEVSQKLRFGAAKNELRLVDASYTVHQKVSPNKEQQPKKTFVNSSISYKLITAITSRLFQKKSKDDEEAGLLTKTQSKVNTIYYIRTFLMQSYATTRSNTPLNTCNCNDVLLKCTDHYEKCEFTIRGGKALSGARWASFGQVHLTQGRCRAIERR